MFTFSLPFFSLLLLFSATATIAQPYKATDHFLLDCGSSTPSTSNSNQRWDGDENSKFVPSDITTTSFSSTASFIDSSVDGTPYYTARIFNVSSFTYTFPVSKGPKFLRLYFYPATYSGHTANQSFFSVSSNGYTLLSNFSAFLTASYLGKIRSDAGGIHAGAKNPACGSVCKGQPKISRGLYSMPPSNESKKSYPDSSTVPQVLYFVKEYVIYVNDDAQVLDVVFTPSPNSYAFINGIEIVSMPENLYYGGDKKYVGNNYIIDEKMALENIYRLNMGGAQLSNMYDTGMYRSWDEDFNYIYGAAFGSFTPLNKTPITYTPETPNYTAPELVYATQRSMGNLSEMYNLTWKLPVDSGFYYMLRLHFCNIIPQYTKRGQVLFDIFINNQTAEKEADLFNWTQGSGYPVVKDYVVPVSDPEGRKSKQDLWIAIHPNLISNEYLDAYLNGLEAFKLSLIGNLDGVNPEISVTSPPASPTSRIDKSNNKTPYGIIIGGVGGGLVLLTVLLVILLWKHKRPKRYSTSNHNPSLMSEGCRRFTLKEVKAATDKFNENCVIGNGGFGKVYRGHIDNSTNFVAIKRFSQSSNQGFQEFKTEIELLSKLRHVHLVSLIGYCDDNEEMILVYEYMMHGTLREHLYKTNNPPLSWKTRLNICIGAAKGLHYLHTSEKRTIIHRDVKSTNILLDENWVAKVSDFGLSKIGFNNPSDTHVTTMVKGSIGYIDPEYCKSQHLRQKSDVYSFGVVLLEVLCARPVIDPWVTGEQVILAEWGKTCYQRGTLVEITDPNIRGEVAVECLRKFGEVAISCLHEEGSARPSMDEVVCGLECALQLQEAAEMDGSVGKAMPEKQEHATMHNDEIEDDKNVAFAKVYSNNGESEESQIIELSPSLSS